MHDLFAAAPKDLRRARLPEYRQYLVDRDGEIDLDNRTLSRREELIRSHETPPARVREMDRAEFRKQYVSFDKRNPPTPEMLLLLTLVKVNSAEAYGVSRNYQQALDRARKSADDLELRVLLEETYHTRILLSAANRYGIEVSDPYRPPSALRVLIGGIATTPLAISRPLVLAAEILGTLMFVKLMEVAQRVLKNDPETRDSVTERLSEICTDERGHISFNRMMMTPADLAQTRLILPILSRVMGGVLPEAVALGAYPRNAMQELPLLDPKKLPEAVRKHAFVA